MTKRTGPTNPELKRMVVGLKKLKKYEKLVKLLEKPRRKKSGVNLSDINKLDAHKVFASEVLGSGDLTKPFIIYAWRYSKSARDKIEKAGGKALDLDDLIRNKDEVHVIQ